MFISRYMCVIMRERERERAEIWGTCVIITVHTCAQVHKTCSTVGESRYYRKLQVTIAKLELAGLNSQIPLAKFG